MKKLTKKLTEYKINLSPTGYKIVEELYNKGEKTYDELKDSTATYNKNAIIKQYTEEKKDITDIGELSETILDLNGAFFISGLIELVRLHFIKTISDPNNPDNLDNQKYQLSKAGKEFYKSVYE